MLRGERVWLRPLEKADVVESNIDDAELAHYAGFKAPFSRDAQERWYQSQLSDLGTTTFQFSICRLGSDAGIGGIGLREIDRANGSASVSIFLGDRASWGTGLGTDAMNALLDFAFGELRLERVWLEVFDYNPRAVRSYEKAGYRLEARLRRARFHRGAYHDVLLMAIIREDWERLERPRSWDLAAPSGDTTTVAPDAAGEAPD